MFSTPTDTARTVLDKNLLYDLMDQCDSCPRFDYERCVEDPFNGPCDMESFEAVLEWLEGDDQ